MLFGPKLNTVFASRWKAVLWSAGVLLTAYCSVPSAVTGKGNHSDAEKIVRMALPPATDAPAPPPHRNPWAK